MKYLFIFLLLTAKTIITVKCQNFETDSLNRLLQNAPQDTNRVKLLIESAYQYYFTRLDSGLACIKKGLSLARELQYKKGEADALNAYGMGLDFNGDYPGSIKTQFDALQINREMNDLPGEGVSFGLIGIQYIELGEYRQALNYLLQADQISQHMPIKWGGSFELANTGDAYDSLKIADSALYYHRKAYEQFPHLTRLHTKAFILRNMGNFYAELGKNDSSLKFYNAAILICHLSKDKLNMSMCQTKIADEYESMHQHDSSFYYARMAFANAQSMQGKLQILRASTLLAKLHRQAHNKDSVIFYLDISAAMNDSLYGPDKFRQLQVLMLNEQQQQQAIIRQQEQFKNKIKYISLLAALGIFLLLAFILYRTNRHKQKANNLLNEQKNKIENTLAELKSTQAQLIQSEKMASLGELTAGIAHEIQNPLNFVNNFSEVNAELLLEMKTEIDKGNMEAVNAIATDVITNEQKLNHHGKRADAIVKGMLQHSRTSTGQKELTDINTLADEYLRLAFHGMRAKDKSFNADFKTDLDNSIEKINIVPQDVGRVLLNLYSNAFYAVSEKMKEASDGYKAIVSVTTRKTGNCVELTVTDNGNGISQKIVDKIFQPFFTTKPTGEGTGLGLSLSYDIIKAHGGEIKVETKEGEGSKFIIQLPIV